MTSADEIKAALTDVRNAYRLLYLYHRRIIDLMIEVTRYMQCQFYYQAYRPGRNLYGREKWDQMLPMLRNCFLFLPPGQNENKLKSGDWMLTIRIRSDSAFPLDENVPNPDISKFPAPEIAKSLLALHVYRSMADQERNWYFGVWEALDWPKNDEVTIEFDGAIKTYGMEYDLVDLIDSAAVESRIKDFQKRLHENLAIM